ncbi:hypothetical protein CTI12_AA166550 [Artemisia annua]|uniref:Uncharacterized protein n=1 Tax=Artemisia annua TaxID=35608 RepID=A0A2U1NZS5_ARTAN|nr:hypothetical protein CTI12_AA166550 [Artemisia annua]
MSSNHLTKRITTPSLAIQFPIKGLQGIVLEFEPGCHSGKIPHMRNCKSRTIDLPHMETITGCINSTDQGIVLEFEPGCHSGKIPHMRNCKSRTIDLPHMETITGCINPTELDIICPG